MNRTLYTLWLYLLSPVIGFYFIYRCTKDVRYLRGLKQRLGFGQNHHSQNDLSQNHLAQSVIHLHCASVGETRAAIPLIQKILINFPQFSLLITTTTPTGRAEVLKLIQSGNYRESNRVNIQHCYLPLDWPGACRRFINHYKPVICILMETEIWPNLIHQLSRNNVPLLLANARLSHSSLTKYQKHSSFSKKTFSKLSMINAQYELDRRNYQVLGVKENNIELVGNMKFDIQLTHQQIEKHQQLKQGWTSSSRPCWIATSIHPKEFAIILDVHKKLLKLFPELLLIAVPRHPENFERLRLSCKKMGLPFVNRSKQAVPQLKHNVVVGDSMGEVMLLCGVADIAFVGGSLNKRGGHNPLEPAVCGLPVIMGPSYYNFLDICKIMQDFNTLEIVTDASTLYGSLKQLLSKPMQRQQRVQNNAQMFIENRGCVDKTIATIKRLLSSKPYTLSPIP